MTIPRTIEGVFIVVDIEEQRRNSPLMDAEEAAAMEMLEEIEDELWGWGGYDENDSSSVFYPSDDSSMESSSSCSSVGSDDYSIDDEDLHRYRYLFDGRYGVVDVDFPIRRRDPNHTRATRFLGGRRPTSVSRLQQLQEEVLDITEELTIPSLTNTSTTFTDVGVCDEDSVVLTERRGIRRHNHQDHHQREVSSSSSSSSSSLLAGEEEFISGGSYSILIRSSERSMQPINK